MEKSIKLFWMDIKKDYFSGKKKASSESILNHFFNLKKPLNIIKTLNDENIL